MIPIPEYALRTAKRLDNGEEITGYYWFDKWGDGGSHYILFDGEDYLVDPDTVNPVRVKPEEQAEIYTAEKIGTCPNCGNREVLEHQKHCDQCGQGLDWHVK